MVELKTVETVDTSPFKKLVVTIGELPTSFVESMTYYELLAWFTNYLQNTIIPAVNNNGEAVIELQEKFVELKTFVDTYFDNLDVQEEINNKLDEMAESGALEAIIDAYLNTTAIWAFDNVIGMTSAENLTNGSYARTLGYYTKNDEGGALYKIRTKTVSDTPNGGSIIAMSDTTLVAELVVENNQIGVKQFGAYGDDTHDDTTAFNAAITFIGTNHGCLYINKGVYKLASKLTIDWNSDNFNQTFAQSFEIKGAGTMESKLHFTSNDGLNVNPNNNGLVIKIHDFCIEKSDYNPLEESGNERTPTVSKGVGLYVKHIGYMGRVANIAIRGFYIGMMSTNCYGGPIFENVFVKNTVFGYYSYQDTTIEHHSCSYVGVETCYLQSGCSSVLTNVIAESNVHLFVNDNTYDQRSKFEGRGFSFINNAYVTSDGCYCEDLYGNAVYINNSTMDDRNSAYNNLMNYHLTTSDYAELNTWLENNPGHNWDDFYISNNAQALYHVKVECGAITGTSSAYVDVKSAASANTYLPHTDTVVFKNPRIQGTWVNNFSRFYHGNTKPIIKISQNGEFNVQNFDYMPVETYGIPLFTSSYMPTNGGGPTIFSTSRKANFTDNTYDETKFKIRHNLDGSIRIYKQTILNGTSVNDTEVIRIAADGKVTFPQN